ncbi:MAG: DsrE/DsrF/DrsH-like family protein [Thermoproteota archaeon]|jgi:peroxiredoxin family protein|nr:DsrE/DsrF/DrsH-like family protein [Thermoproteota archaeon]
MEKKNRLLIVASKGTADALYPALILATTAASQNMRVDIYFTFGGMKLLIKGMAETIKPSVDLGLSQEDLTKLLQKGGMPTLKDMLKMAKEMGVKIHACSPTMNLFGLTEEDLTKDVCDDIIGAATFLEMASDPNSIVIFI